MGEAKQKEGAAEVVKEAAAAEAAEAAVVKQQAVACTPVAPSLLVRPSHTGLCRTRPT